ncbi:hypothetical protein Tco_0059150 [Tanacetum coccineum]
MSQYKSISKRQGSPYHTVDNDGVLDRLKFIRKGEIHQVYGKSIPETLITHDIQNSKVTRRFILYPLKWLNEGAGLGPEVPDEPTGKSAVSDEGVGTSPEVPDETKDKHKAQDDLVDWGSTNDETFLFDDKEENPEDIPWVLGIQKYRSLPLISLDSSLSNNWKLVG